MSDATAPLKEIIEKVKSGRALYFAVKETQAVIAERAFSGTLTDGSQVQYKEDYEVYAYQPPSPRKPSGKGKPFTQWKRPPQDAKGGARKIKGGYYETYLKYKDAMGREDTPFELTGRLRKAFLSDAALIEGGSLTVDVTLKGEDANKYRGLTDSKGEFLTPSVSELEYFKQRLVAQI